MICLMPRIKCLRLHLLLLPHLLFLLGSYKVRGQTINTMTNRLKKLEQVTSQLTRQLMLQQLYVEEMARTSGDSGIKQIRRRNNGPKPYFTETYTSRSVAAIHDHSDHIRTVGMGEVAAVLNGVEFRTRHNDYKLRMPSHSSGDYHATEDIPFPAVPPEVLQRTSIQGQVIEMRKWFQAWQQGDHSVRDYRKYFRPHLCYLEGAWTTDEELDEPFDSDRHHLEAASWFELQEQIRFTSYTGSKNLNENFAYLPTTVLNLTDDGVPVFGQWNYRILCHPIQGDLRLSLFQPVENLANRLASRRTFHDYVLSRAARFRLDAEDGENSYRWSLLDEIMYQIPGKDNYNASLYDTQADRKRVTFDTEQPLNAGFYHRVHKVLEKDAMGEKNVFNGYSDRNLFVAETTQPRIAALSVPYCKTRRDRRRGTCQTISKRVSYAVPLEIVFTTPLQSWNPYDLEFKGEPGSRLGRTVKGNGVRNGRLTADRAFNGTNSKAYYLTPAKFFIGSEVGKTPADTSRKSVGVLDPSGQVRAMRSSGIRIHLPHIPNLGILRTRWPILPVSTEGHPAWKELEALRDVVMDMRKHIPYFPTTPPFPDHILQDAANNSSRPHVVLVTSPSNPVPLGLHSHTIELSKDQFRELRAGNGTVVLDTSEDNNHSHRVLLDFDEKRKEFRMVQCDGMAVCFDGHDAVLQREPFGRRVP